MSEIGRRGLASEAFGFDPFLQAQRMKRDSMASDAKSLVKMVKSQGGFWKGLKEGARVVAAGALVPRRLQILHPSDLRRAATKQQSMPIWQAVNAIVIAANRRPGR